MTGDEDKLITQERLDNDKFFRYVINPEKYRKISSLINPSMGK